MTEWLNRLETRGCATSLETRACPHLGDSGAAKTSIHRGSADLELTDATLWHTRRSMGAYPGPAAWSGGTCGSDGGRQPAVRRGGAVPLPHRHAVARSAGALR